MFKKVSILLLVFFTSFSSQSNQTINCVIFPKSNIWNTQITNAPVHKQSLTWLNAIGKGVKVHPDFGSKRLTKRAAGIPVNYTNKNTPKLPILFRYEKESDIVKYPIPKYVKIEGGIYSKGDRHIISLDTDTCILYELFNVHRRDSGKWTASSGAVFKLNSNDLRPQGWTSADAAGLPIFPGLIRYSEVKKGSINHALRFTLPVTNRKYLWPARHFASRHNNPNLPPMGMRLRLKENIDISNFSPQAKVIATALKKYGMILADNGGAMFISGEPNKNWSNWGLRDLKKLVSNNFEVVDVSSLQVHKNSATTSKTETYHQGLSSPKKTNKQYNNKAKYYIQFYVSPYGDDSYDGTNERPWRTLQHAADLAVAGDTINIEKGNYSPFKIHKSGKKNHPITFGGDNAVIDAFLGGARDGIEIKNAKYITIKGFKVHHANRAGISAVTCSNIIIEWNKLIKNNYWGIFTGFCSNLIIKHNVTAQSVKQHGIYVSNTSKNISIYDNVSYSNNGAGIQLNADKSMGGIGLITNASIYNNLIYYNGRGGGAAINLDGVQNSKIYNNILYDNYATGIASFMGDAADGSKYNQIVYNTIVMPKDGRWCTLFKNNSSYNTFKNNVCVSFHPYRGAISIDDSSLIGFDSNYNAYTPIFTLDGGESIIHWDKWLSITDNDKMSVIVKNIENLFDFTLKKFTPFSKGGLYKKGIYLDEFKYDYNKHLRTNPPDIGAINH
ncbi:MAG: right-handed parallel beta-helix repeat-containing protein [Pseudomonadota bacterium]